MKLTTTRNVDNQLGDLESRNVRIKASGKAFSTLVRGIYKDGIAAFVREIATNALDAHIDQGCPELPFRVDLPDAIDPYYRVRDFGISMDHDTVFDIFGTLFESTKDDSNEVVGAFGLGSKAPLAYADSFEVSAFLDGVRRTYLVSIDAEGTPVITLLSTTDCDDPQGLEVAIPVREDDFHLVHAAAKKILPGFDIMPEVIGSDDIKPFTVLESVNDDEVRLVKRDADVYYGRAMSLKVRMGCVLYPVELSDIGFGWNERLDIGNCDLIINVPMGSVGITTSREALDLTPETKEMLKGMVQRANDAVKGQVEAKFTACATRLEAVQLWKDEGTKDYWEGKIEYRGKALNEWIYLDHDKATGDRRDQIPYVRTGTKRSVEPMSQIRISSVENMRLVYGDTKAVKRATLRYREFVDECEYSHDVYWLTNPNKNVMERLTRLAGFTSDNFVWVGSLEDPGPAKRGERRARGAGKPQGVKLIEEDGHRYLLPEAESLPEDYYWIEGSRLKRYQVRTDIDSLIACKAHGGDDLPLLAFTPSAVKRYKPKAEREMSKALKTVLDKKKDEIKEAYLAELIYNRLPGGHVDEVLGGEYDRNLSNMGESLLTYDERSELGTQATDTIAEYKSKYPMLFTLDRQQVEAYIAEVDAE